MNLFAKLYSSNPSGPLIHMLKCFRIWLRFCGDISIENSNFWLCGVFDTAEFMLLYIWEYLRAKFKPHAQVLQHMNNGPSRVGIVKITRVQTSTHNPFNMACFWLTTVAYIYIFKDTGPSKRTVHDLCQVDMPKPLILLRHSIFYSRLEKRSLWRRRKQI